MIQQYSCTLLPQKDFKSGTDNKTNHQSQTAIRSHDLPGNAVLLALSSNAMSGALGGTVCPSVIISRPRFTRHLSLSILPRSMTCSKWSLELPLGCVPNLQSHHKQRTDLFNYISLLQYNLRYKCWIMRRCQGWISRSLYLLIIPFHNVYDDVPTRYIYLCC